MTQGTFAWFTSHDITCDWACHRKRGSRGGEDRDHPVGSPILAPYDAIVTYGLYDDGASFVQFKYTNGYAHQAVHPQIGGRVAYGARVGAGTVCALSDGRPDTYGAGTSTGHHIHFQGHKPDGTRIPWQDVPAPTVQLAGITVRPITIAPDPTEEDTDMRDLITVSHPDQSGNQVYWSLDLRASTKRLITGGVELEFRRNIGIPEYLNQPPALVNDYRRI